ELRADPDWRSRSDRIVGRRDARADRGEDWDLRSVCEYVFTTEVTEVESCRFSPLDSARGALSSVEGQDWSSASSAVWVEIDMKVRASVKRICDKCKIVQSEEHTSELQSRSDLVCRLLL